MNLLESQEVTSDTELLVVADALLSLGSEPTSQQMPSAPLLSPPTTDIILTGRRWSLDRLGDWRSAF